MELMPWVLASESLGSIHMKIIMSIIVIVILFILTAGFMLFRMVFDRDVTFLVGGGDDQAPDPLLEPTGTRLAAYNDVKKQEYRRNSFQEMKLTSRDGLELVADFLEGTNPKETVILVHGYRSDGAGDWCAISEIYKRRGCYILIVEDRAHGRSQGRYIGFSELDRFDVQMWCEKIAQLYPTTTIYLHGMSMGGATVLHAANMRLPSQVRGIISDCGFNSIIEVTRHLMKTQFHIPYFPIGYVAWMFARMIAGVSFNKSDGVRSISESHLPLLQIVGSEDRYVPIETVQRIAKSCKTYHDEIIVDGAGHAASYMIAEKAYEQKVNEFLDHIRMEN